MAQEHEVSAQWVVIMIEFVQMLGFSFDAVEKFAWNHEASHWIAYICELAKYDY